MTITNAEEARKLTVQYTWDLNKLLDAIETAATNARYHIFILGELNDVLVNELTVRGFRLSYKEPDTKIEW